MWLMRVTNSSTSTRAALLLIALFACLQITLGFFLILEKTPGVPFMPSQKAPASATENAPSTHKHVQYQTGGFKGVSLAQSARTALVVEEKE